MLVAGPRDLLGLGSGVALYFLGGSFLSWVADLAQESFGNESESVTGWGPLHACRLKFMVVIDDYGLSLGDIPNSNLVVSTIGSESHFGRFVPLGG